MVTYAKTSNSIPEAEAEKIMIVRSAWALSFKASLSYIEIPSPKQTIYNN